MSINEYDSDFIAQVSGASKRREQQSQAVHIGAKSPELQQEATNNCSDPTRDIRKKQANLCDAVMMRVVELEREAASLTEIAKKLRAAVLANT
jgi:hypothetical protein